MNIQRAFLAGVAGGVAMSVGLATARAAGLAANLELMLGTMTGLRPGAGALVFGFALHLLIAGLIGLIYAWGFEHVTHRSGAAIGAAFSVVNAIAGGIFMGLVPLMHPLIPESMPAPGAFIVNLGTMGILAEFVLHLMYGSVVGAVYDNVHVPVRV
jgi:hypothetical protein